MPLLDLDRVWKAYQDIIDADVLEDRREYDVDDLVKSTGLDLDDAQYLHRLIQTNFDPNAATLYHSHWEPAHAQELAQLITESIHQSFDGWSDAEKVVITLYLHDLAVGLKAIQKDKE